MNQTNVKKEIFSWIGSAIIGVSIALFISIFLIQATKVVGTSMDPSLKDGQRIYISKISRVSSYKPHYGDIVIIDSRVGRPRSWKDEINDSPLIKWIFGGGDHDIWVKRVIGKPGDIIEFRNGKVCRNGKVLTETYIKEPMESAFHKIIIPEDHVWVMGDNRNHSGDSRMIGPVPIDHVLGKKIKVPFIE